MRPMFDNDSKNIKSEMSNYGIVNKIIDLQSHKSADICENVFDILERYFPETEEED